MVEVHKPHIEETINMGIARPPPSFGETLAYQTLLLNGLTALNEANAPFFILMIDVPLVVQASGKIRTGEFSPRSAYS